MANPDIRNLMSLMAAEHVGGSDSGENVEGKRTLLYAFDTDTTQWRRVAIDAEGHVQTSLVGDGGIFNPGVTNTKVAVTEDGELMVAETPQERNVLARLSINDVAASVYAILVDLSDTTNFPHDSTGRIDISDVALQIDRNSTAMGRVILGVITRIDGTSADITYATGLMFSKNNVQSIVIIDNYAPSQLKLGVVDGETPFFISSAKETNVTAVNTGVTLNSPRGAATVTPGVGDVIVKFEWSAGTYDANVRAFYHSEA